MNVEINLETTFDQVLQWIKTHEKGKSVDPGNLKLVYNSLMDKVEAKVKENEREQQRKVSIFTIREQGEGQSGPTSSSGGPKSSKDLSFLKI